MEISRRRRSRRDDDLAPRVGAERAVGAERDRPDFEARRDGVIEPAGADADAEDAPLRRGVAIGRRIGAVEGGARYVERRGVDRRSGEPLGRASVDAVVVDPDLAAVHAEAMDQPGPAIDRQQRVAVGLVGEAAERRAGIGRAVERHVGEQADGAA